MIRATHLALLLAATMLPGCVTYSSEHHVGAESYELARTRAPDGAEEVYVLERGDSLRIATEYQRDRPFLGFQVQELDKARALERGVEPYSGLLVSDTYPKSSARAAGVRPGDVLLSIGDAKTSYLEHLSDAEARLDDQQAVTATLLRGAEQLELELRTNMLREDVRDLQHVRLEKGPTPRRAYAGVALLGIPRPWCERIFGDTRDACVVSTVELGSPAWVAGIRGGDVIEQVDGAPCPPIDELYRVIAAKGKAGESTTWSVRREQGVAYEATIPLADYRDGGAFVVPLLFGYSDTAAKDRWSVGPWGMVMSNRNSYVADSSTRAPQTRNVFSALLGLLQVDSRPDETRVRLLWLIRFDT